MKRAAALVLAIAGGSARADVATPAESSAQGLGLDVGSTTGGGWTPGGLRLAGHYLSQLGTRDWIDGVAAVTLGGGGAGCAYDAADHYDCQHGFADGDAVELVASVRHYLTDDPAVAPFLRGGIGVGLVRFPDDVVNTMTSGTAAMATPSTGELGLAISLRAGAGLRLAVAPAVAIIGAAELELGIGAFQGADTLAPQLGFILTAGAELRL